MYRPRLTPLTVIIGLWALSTVPALVSQSAVSQEYDAARHVVIKGMLVGSAAPKPPYSVYLLVTATDAKGNEQHWAVEGSPIDDLRKRGHKDDALTMGEVITVTGHPRRPGKRPEDRMPMPLRGAIHRASVLAKEGRIILGTEITRADGKKIPFGRMR
jgi:hypothetical protein